jgi:Zn finger protein HypA/HybF involved in hydrogenase expression
MQAAGMTPLEPFKKVIAKWRYRCDSCKNEGSTTLHNVRRGHGCPYCGKIKVDPKKIEARLKEAGLEPLEPYVGNNNKWKMKHLVCGKVVFTTWHELQSGGGGCGTCRYDKISEKLRTPEDDAVRIMRSAGGEPLEPFRNIHAKWKIKCLKCGVISYPLLSNVQKGQGVCMHCRPKSPVVTESKAYDFVISKGLVPVGKYKSAQSNWKLKCNTCKKTDFYVYSWMKSGNYGCVYCSRHKIDPKDALSKFRRMGFEPLEPFISSKKGIQVRCLNCNKSYRKTYDTLQSGRGCKYCQTAALELLAPSYFYIIQNEDFRAIKVGIANLTRRTDRIKAHKNQGWLLLYRQDLDTGEIALELEQQVLSWLRQDRKLGIYLEKSQMPQGGWTETVDSAEISLFEIREYFENLLKNYYQSFG